MLFLDIFFDFEFQPMEEFLSRHGFVPLSLFAMESFGICCELSVVFVRCSAKIPKDLKQRPDECNAVGDDLFRVSTGEFVNLLLNKDGNGTAANVRTSVNFLMSAKWERLFAVLGYRRSTFLLTECTIVEIVNGCAVLIAGSLKEILPDAQNAKKVNRETIFYKQGRLKSLSAELVMEYLLGDLQVKDKIKNRIRKRVGVLIKAYRKIKSNCIYKEYFKNKENIEGEDEIKSVIQNNIHPNKVIDFLFIIAKKLLTKLVAKCLFPAIKGKLAILVKRNIREGLTVNELVKYVKLSQMKIFPKRVSRNDMHGCTEVCRRFWVFIFNEVFIPHISHFFYSTVGMTSRLQVRFYHRSIWTATTSQFYKTYLQRFEVVSNGFQGVTLRCIPRAETFRVIANCARDTQASMSLNRKLAPFQTILDAVPLSSKSRSLQSFQTLRNLFKNKPSNSSGRYFMVKVDFSNCYDMLKHDYLLRAIHDAFSDDFYYFSEFKAYYENKNGYLESRWIRRADKTFCTAEHAAYDYKMCILKETRQRIYTRDEVVSIISSLVCNVAVNYNKMVYKPLCGILQGCSISPALCDLYCTAACVAFIEPLINSGLFYRYVDDLLLITPSLLEIRKFLMGINRLEERGLVANPDKFRSNLDKNTFNSLRSESEPESISFDGASVEWCGLRIYDNGRGIKSARPDSSFRFTIIVPQYKQGMGIFQGIKWAFIRKTNGLLISCSNKLFGENLFDAFYFAARRLRIVILRADFVNRKHVENVLDWTIERAVSCIEERKIQFDRQKIREMAAKAFKNAGITDGLGRKWMKPRK